MTFVQYLQTQPVMCWICIIIMILSVFIVTCALCSGGREVSLLPLVGVLNVLLLCYIIWGINDYCTKQKAIDNNYTVYINGERSFSTSPKEAILDTDYFYSHINTKKGWILSELKPEDKDTTQYFSKYNKEVPQ